ncbi:MAG: glycosyltransferase family 1 protein [bacterium]
MRIIYNAVTSNSIIRGVDRYNIEILYRFDKINRAGECFVIYGPWQKYYPLKDTRNIKFICKKIPHSQLLRNFWQAFIFPFFTRRLKPDLVHLSNTMPLFFKFYPTIVTIPDVLEDEEKTFHLFQRIYRRYMVKRICKYAEIVITISNYIASLIYKRFPRDKIEVVYLSTFKRDITEKEGNLNLPDKYLLFVGTIDPHKNILRLTQAYFEFLKQNDGNLSFVIVGAYGRDYEKFNNLINASEYKSRIYYYTDVSNAQLLEIYKKAFMVVFPSITEGFGLPILEAMGEGVPVITSNTASMPEVAGDAAILVDPYSTDQITAAINDLYNDKELRNKLIKKGYERIKLFSWDKTAEKIFKLYCELKLKK